MWDVHTLLEQMSVAQLREWIAEFGLIEEELEKQRMARETEREVARLKSTRRTGVRPRAR